MDTKWKSVKAVLSFCFLLASTTIFVLFAIYSVVVAGSSDLRRIGESFAADYQETGDFRGVMENYLRDGLYVAMFSESSSADSLLQDRNLRYEVYDGTKLLAANTQEMDERLMSRQVKGYNFYLKYQNGTVTLWKDGEELDVYGDGVYRGVWEQWDVPGYSNRSIYDYLYDWITARDPEEIREMTADVTIWLAAAETPAEYQQWSSLYGIVRGQENVRWAVFLAGGIGLVGLVLLVWTILWRRHLGRAWAALAGVTGRIWLEIKLILLLPLLWLLLWLFLDLLNCYISEEGALLLWLEAVLLSLYLNDCVRNWGHLRVHSFCGWLVRNLRAREQALPVQNRLIRRSFLSWLGVLILAAGAAAMDFVLFLSTFQYPPLTLLTIVLGILGLAIIVQQWSGWKAQKRLAQDLGRVAQQIGDMSAGHFDPPEQLPQDGDLSALSKDLIEIGGGLQKAVEERTHSERMKVALITNVSHDLKTPLTSILSYTDLLAQEELPETARDYVKILQEKAERLRVMVREVFEVSKATTGNLDIRWETLDLGKLLRQTLADQAEPMERSGLTFRVELPEGEVSIRADGDRLYRVFQNLIQNALQYAMPGSRVYITLEEDETQAVVRIRNISRDELPQDVDFTERFVRGDESRTDGGSGLGLAIAKSFTEACGGQFMLKTEADLFTVEITFRTV